MKMTYREALAIQWQQMLWYRQLIGLKGIRAIRKATKPCPYYVNPDEPIDVIRINSWIPRGGDFEKYIRHTKTEKDPLTIHFYTATAKGFI